METAPNASPDTSEPERPSPELLFAQNLSDTLKQVSLLQNELIQILLDTPWDRSIEKAVDAENNKWLSYCFDAGNLFDNDEACESFALIQERQFANDFIRKQAEITSVVQRFRANHRNPEAEARQRMRLLAWADYLARQLEQPTNDTDNNLSEAS